MSITKLFELLVGESRHMVILLDEWGGVAGLVTLEDLIETLLGLEIVDESDTTTDMQELARKLWRERAAKLGLDPTDPAQPRGSRSSKPS
jgi:CBS domain containing-hemolysin-like protein